MNAITRRQTREKDSLIEQFRKTPVIQVACEKTGIVRSTYYRWISEDPVFAKNAEDAIHEGKSLINDMAISQLISSIRDRSLPAILFWLRHNHEEYKDKVEITTHTKAEALTPEQEQILASALIKGGLLQKEKQEDSDGK